MLNMGFVDDVELILNAGGAENIQTLLFSATLPGWVKDIQKRFLKPDFKLVDLVGNEKQKVCWSLFPYNGTPGSAWFHQCLVNREFIIRDWLAKLGRGGRSCSQ